MSIKKSPLEIKQDRLIKKWKESIKKKSIPKKKKSKKAKPQKEKRKTKEEYHKELTDVRWFIKRASILKLDDNRCRHCGSKNDLQVHHMTYIGNKKAWEYDDKYLITLCKDCHSKEHHLYFESF